MPSKGIESQRELFVSSNLLVNVHNRLDANTLCAYELLPMLLVNLHDRPPEFSPSTSQPIINAPSNVPAQSFSITTPVLLPHTRFQAVESLA